MEKALLAALFSLPLAAWSQEAPSIACNKGLAGAPAYLSIATRLPLDSMLNISFANPATADYDDELHAKWGFDEVCDAITQPFDQGT